MELMWTHSQGWRREKGAEKEREKERERKRRQRNEMLLLLLLLRHVACSMYTETNGLGREMLL